MFLSRSVAKKIIQSESNGHEGLGSNVVNFCKQHCPVLVKVEVFANNTVHLLDLMYHLIVPRPQSPPQPLEPEEAQQNPVPEPQPATEPNHEPQPEPVFVNLCENIGRQFSGSWQSQILTILAVFIFVTPFLIVVDLDNIPVNSLLRSVELGFNFVNHFIQVWSHGRPNRFAQPLEKFRDFFTP